MSRYSFRNIKLTYSDAVVDVDCSTGTTVSGIIVFVDLCPEVYANVSDVTMKMIATAVVILLSTVAGPVDPKNAWPPDADPNAAPISEPLPV